MRIYCNDGTILTKAFGSGIAFPTLTNDGMQRPDHGKKGVPTAAFMLLFDPFKVLPTSYLPFSLFYNTYALYY